MLKTRNRVGEAITAVTIAAVPMVGFATAAATQVATSLPAGAVEYVAPGGDAYEGMGAAMLDELETQEALEIIIIALLGG